MQHCTIPQICSISLSPRADMGFLALNRIFPNIHCTFLDLCIGFPGLDPTAHCVVLGANHEPRRLRLCNVHSLWPLPRLSYALCIYSQQDLPTDCSDCITRSSSGHPVISVSEDYTIPPNIFPDCFLVYS